ncbi:MAG: N-acetylmuramoyl-L-alanine amidase [Actinomycetota bacterium]
MSGWTGDPVWLADVLRADGQINVRELDGWRGRGHGDFKDIRGIMFHHTGGPASAESIRDGRPDLPGPLSQLHISRTGVVTVVCAGVAWHAGVGSLPWVPANMGNWHLIGVECEWPYPGSGVTGPGNAHLCPWDDRQIKAMRNVAAAVCRKLAYGADRVTTHKEYAGAAQGKWDPGFFDPRWFRGEAAKDLSGFQFPGEGTTPTQTPPPVPAPLPPPAAHRDVLLYRGVNDPAAVRKLQTILKAKIVSRLVVDGDYGPATEAAVRAFQQSKYRKPPLVVDGVVGPATAAQLGLVL